MDKPVMSDRVQRVLFSLFGVVIFSVAQAVQGYDLGGVVQGDPVALKKLGAVLLAAMGTGILGFAQTWLNDFSPAQRSMELRARSFRRTETTSTEE